MTAQAVLSGPGKTAPRWIQDLLEYDPRHRESNGRNLLAEPALQFHGEAITRREPSDCRHSLTRKDHFWRGPRNTHEKPSEDTEYCAATFCSKCQHHFHINVSFKPTTPGQKPCHLADPANRMHHLRPAKQDYIKDINGARKDDRRYSLWVEEYMFKCSGAKCPATVQLVISPPRLDKTEMLSKLLDPAGMRARGEREIKSDPKRMEGEQPVTPAMALGYLRSWISDALTRPPRKIAMRNRKYRLGFADDFHDLFRYLDFVEVVTPPTEVEEELHFWQPPEITDDNRDFITDVYTELGFLVAERPPMEFLGSMKTVVHNPLPAVKDIQLCLGCWDYPTRSRTINLDHEEHPYYASLGVLDDFTDEYLDWAYDRQRECDPANKPYYLDCLLDLATGRKSAELEEKAAIAVSAGEQGFKTIHEAFKFFLLDPYNIESEDQIIGIYSTRVQSAPRQKIEAKKNLEVIANYIGSTKIKAVANDNAMSFEEALQLLGVTADTSSDIIEAYAIASEMEKGRVVCALKVIAKNRGGDPVLLNAVANMGTGESSRSVADAYKTLHIDPSANMPEETILGYYNHHLKEDNPNAEAIVGFTEALRVIATDLGSKYLLRKLADPNAEDEPNVDGPIGLVNIGNTCYLNSLLQFYYTVVPVRDTVLDFPQYRMEINNQAVEQKRVGERKVDRVEIEKSQTFVEELGNLFIRLRTAPTRSIQPTKRLAQSIFGPPTKERGFSVSGAAAQPNVGENSDTPVNGTELPSNHPQATSPGSSPPLPSATTEDMEMGDKPISGDDASDITLVDELPSYEDTEKDSDKAHFPVVDKTSQEPAVEVREVGDEDTVMVNGDSHMETEDQEQVVEKPPPIPPRNKSNLTISTDKEISEEYNIQQDVTEVMENVIFRLRCAIKPTSIEEDSGEQIDIIRDTFYGSTATFTQKTQTPDKKVEAFKDITCFPAVDGARDIYEALDGFFDLQMVKAGETVVPQWTSVVKLPPVLPILIQRSGFKDGAQHKNQQPVVFSDTLYMDRYMDSTDPSMLERRQETWRLKKVLRKVEARLTALNNEVSDTNLNVPDSLNAIKDFCSKIQKGLSDVEIPPTLLENLGTRAEELAREILLRTEQIRVLKIKVANQFEELRKHEYKLHAVFFHRGGSQGGHYWVSIYDYQHNIWRQYNDQHVGVVEASTIFDPPRPVGGGFPATPYYLVYIRSHDREKFVQPVSREIVYEPVNMNVDMGGEVVDEGFEEITMNDSDANGDVDMLPALVNEDDLDSGKEPEKWHVENVKPRPLRPKVPNGAIAKWEDATPTYDAHGKKW